MKKTSKLLAVLLAALMVITLAVTAVSAENGLDNNTPNPDDTGYSEISDDPNTYTDPDDSGSVDTGNISDNGDSGDNSGDPVYTDDPNYTGDPEYTDPDTQSGDGDTDTGSDDYYQYFTDDDDPLWYGDPADYGYYNSGDNDVSAGSVTDTTQLFHTSGTNRDDVAPNAWTEIKLDEKTASAGSGSFSSIKSNTAKNDNGQWILYLGYALVILAVLGILYFITATVSARKQNRRAIRHSAGAGSSATYTTLEKPERGGKSSGSARSTGRYADGYEGYSSRRASKADTGEIYVPRRVK